MVCRWLFPVTRKEEESESSRQDVQPQLKGEDTMKDLEAFIRESEKNAIPDNQIDLSDIPEITDFSKGHFRNWKPVKKPVTVRIDSDVLYWLKGSETKGYQKRLNDTLRWAMNHNNC